MKRADHMLEKYLEAKERMIEKEREHKAFSRKNKRYLEKVLNTRAWFEAYETFEEQSGYNEVEDAFIAAEVELVAEAAGITKEEVYRIPLNDREKFVARLIHE